MDNIEVNELSNMIGSTFVSVLHDEANEELVFERDDKTKVVFWHEQDCCENVYIEDICGELSDLIGYPLLVAEERISEGPSDSYESSTYTFYEFRTIKGSVTVRWCGSSNGYYSESVAMFDTQSNAYNGYCRPCNTKI